MTNQTHSKNKSHIPSNSLLFNKVIPLAFIVMGLITISLILFAAGVLLGLVHF
jgi:hypothetical protein